MTKGKKTSAMLPKRWKKSFIGGISIPNRMRFCNECNDKRSCKRCNNQINENKKIKVIINFQKRQAPIELGHMLSFFKE